MYRFALLALLAVPGFAGASQQPNIVLIVADDLGWADVSYHASRADTPNIDRLVSQGAELDRFYVAPMCSPTRAGLMTGRYPIRFGLARAVIPPQRDFGLDPNETTIAEALGKLGYKHRGVFGKWHLGHHRPQWHPLSQGFTHFHGHYNGAIDYFALTRENIRDWHVDWTPSNEQGYSTTLIGNAAAKWIEQVAEADPPYFCYVPFNAPHSPFQALPEDLDRYGDIPAVAGKKKPSKLSKNRQAIAAMIWRMDVAIGHILDTIEATGEADNTIVWFTSDNGGVSAFPNNNKPLRGDKLDVFEGGIRVPACVKWPVRIPAGRKLDNVTGYIDVLPTLLAAAHSSSQVNAMSERPQRPLDGKNLLPYFEGHVERLAPRDWFSYHGQSGPHSEHIAVRNQEWKLVVLGPQLDSAGVTDGHQVELFRIEDDPYETMNVAAEYPAVVEQLVIDLIDYRALQPSKSVPPYKQKNRGFVPPELWRLSAGSSE
jgi:arylsulfatase A-like enzyme